MHGIHVGNGELVKIELAAKDLDTRLGIPQRHVTGYLERVHRHEREHAGQD